MKNTINAKLYDSIMEGISMALRRQLNESYASSAIQKIQNDGSLNMYNTIIDGKHQLNFDYTHIGSLTDNDIFMLNIGQKYSLGDLRKKFVNDFHAIGWNTFSLGFIDLINALADMTIKKVKQLTWCPAAEWLKKFDIDASEIIIENGRYDIMVQINKLVPKTDNGYWSAPVDMCIVEDNMQKQKAIIAISSDAADVAYDKRQARKANNSFVEPMEKRSKIRKSLIHAYDDELSDGTGSYGDYKLWTREISKCVKHCLDLIDSNEYSYRTHKPYTMEDIRPIIKNCTQFKYFETDKIFRKWIEKHYPELYSELMNIGVVE